MKACNDFVYLEVTPLPCYNEGVLKQFSFFQDQKKLQDFCAKNHIHYLGMFGSYARGDQKQASDVDLLVEFDPDNTPSLFDVADISIDLEDQLNKKVDLVIRKNIRPELKPYVMKDVLTVFEKN